METTTTRSVANEPMGIGERREDKSQKLNHRNPEMVDQLVVQPISKLITLD